MAVVDDILTTLSTRIAAGLYPNGTGQPSVIGSDVRIYPGWPVRSKLDADLRAGVSHVTVYPDSHERSEILHFREWRDISRAEKLIEAAIVGNVVTFSGTPVPPQTITAVVGVGSTTTSYPYAVQGGDTPTIVATGLAALIDGASNVGPVLTLPGAARVKIAIGVWGTQGRMLRWNAQRVMTCLWAATPDLRASLTRAIDATLAPLERIELTDGSIGYIEYHGGRTMDELGEAVLFRRTLFHDIEYPTIETVEAPEIIIIDANHAGDQWGGIEEPVETILGGTP